MYPILLFLLAALVPLPAASLEEIGKNNPVPLGIGQGVCAKEDVASAFSVKIAGVDYKLILMERKGDIRFMLLDNRDGADTPVWVGRVVDGRLVVDREYKYKEIENLDPTTSLCALLYEVRV